MLWANWRHPPDDAMAIIRPKTGADLPDFANDLAKIANAREEFDFARLWVQGSLVSCMKWPS
jgi:hypothetical protein